MRPVEEAAEGVQSQVRKCLKGRLCGGGSRLPWGLGEALSPHLPRTQALLPQTPGVLVKRPTLGFRRPLQTKPFRGSGIAPILA